MLGLEEVNDRKPLGRIFQRCVWLTRHMLKGNGLFFRSANQPNPA
jgi:hypothetical protein